MSKILHKCHIRQVLLLLLIFVGASCVGFLFQNVGFPDTNIVMVYLLAVLLTAWLAHSFIFGFLASVLATFFFNYFFVQPYFAFSVNDPNYIVTFIIMTVTALITSTLTSHAQRSAHNAQIMETETKAIYNLTNHLTDATGIHDIARIAVEALSNSFGCQAACLCFGEAETPEQSFIQQNDYDIRRQAEDQPTGYVVGPEFCDWPIYGSESILGAIRIPNASMEALSDAQKRLLRSMVESAALAMDRFRSVDQRIKSREEIVKERYRANLLRSISHDLRTPLSGIIGASEMLMDMTEQSDPRYALADGIHKDADWLHSLMENILNLTRLEDGSLALDKQTEAVEEVVGEAINHIAGRSPGREIGVSVPDELLLVPMDARLIQQVLINFLDNAIKHTKPWAEISVTAKRAADSAVFTISDRGTGIPAADLPHLFQTFYTARIKRPDEGYGVGLGLAICETIIKAHGGTIEASNRTDGPGAEFTFTLPMEETINESPQ